MPVLIQESERSCIWLGDRFCPFLLFVFFDYGTFTKVVFLGIMELSQKKFLGDYGTFPNVVFPPSIYWLNKGDRKIKISQTAAFRLSIINGFCLMVFNATFTHISVISWWSVLLVEETGGHAENHRPVASHWQTLSHNVGHSPWSILELTTSVVIGTDCIGSCKSNCHAIMATTAPIIIGIHFLE